MEMESTGGRDGDQEQTNSISYSSSSGTIVSTQTTYTSRGSRLSSFSIEAAMHLDVEESDYYDREEEEGAEKGVRIRILLQEFLGAPPPSANCSSIKGGGVLDLERWFTELSVAWVLHLNLADGGGASAGILEHTTTTSKARSWIRALAEITETIRFTASLFPDHPSQGLSSIFEDEEEEPEANGHCFPDQFNDIGRSIQQEPEAEYYFPDQFNDIEPFIQEAMSKMLSFVDIIVALDPNNTTTCESFVDNGNGVPPLYNRINILLSVHNALSKALSKVRLVFHSPPSQQVERMTGEIVSLLSAKNRKAGDAIWSTMEQIRMESIEDGGNSSTSSQDPQAGSSDIHTATRSVIGVHNVPTVSLLVNGSNCISSI
ncbi:uncharacterized protein [Miscanthus floridulus]|uniref:uncharacterized protein n=1 Tax=Miscanthus floridulus TaxID=154761 RepID=UPI00345A44F9